MVKVGPVASLAVVAAAFTIGIVASVVADRGDPEAGKHRKERAERLRQEGEPEPAGQAK